MDAGAADPLALIGTTIAEKYAVESVVGHGGFAIVYRAMHVLWKRPVAVKVFKALGEVAAKDRQKLLDDFIQEGALLADLSERSSAICQARDVGMLTTAAGETVPYMVLEWLEGKPLDAVLEDERMRGAPLRPLDEAVRLLDSAAEALALAHKTGIAHRDVKPANVFVLGDPRGDYNVKLLDFGIAKVVQDAQKMGFGKTAGHITSFTPSYGAPEQFNRSHGSTGPWTDVFALALVVTEVLTGRDPLDGDNLVQLAFSSADPTKRPTPRLHGKNVGDEAEAVLAKALAVKPADRYQTGGEFWNALRIVALGRGMALPITARPSQMELKASPAAFAQTAAIPPSSNAETLPRPTDPGPLPGPPASKTPLIAGIAAVALLLGGGGAYFAFGRKHDAKPAVVPTASAPPIPLTASALPPPTKACPPGMKPIPGGEYFMGSDEKNAEPNEKPPHKVKLGPYCLDELEVTVAQYKECSDHGACLRAGKANVWEGKSLGAVQSSIYDPLCNINDVKDKANHPINCVGWAQAVQFCENRGARLPTEAEWELAARGFDGRVYPWGDDPPNATLLNACGTECVAWMKAHPDPDAPITAMFESDDGFANTAPVGSFPKGKSSSGIQDMVGNVWEWVADWYAVYDPSSAATTQTDPKGPETGTERIIRGGAWNGGVPSWVRPSFRFHALPDNRSYGTGFRCAKTL